MNKTKAEVTQAFSRALDWLEANPDKHIAGRLASTRRIFGDLTSTNSPAATCFCALGRFAHEMGLDTAEISVAAQPLIDTRVIKEPGTVYVVNDRNVKNGDRPQAIAWLRSLIA